MYLSKLVAIGEEYCEDGAATEEVLNFESIDIRVVGRLVVIKHKVDDIGLSAKEEDLEGGVPESASGEGPEDVY